MRSESSRYSCGASERSVAGLVSKIKLFIPLGDAIDLAKEEKRISEKIKELENYLFQLEKKLGNSNFIQRAPSEVVEKEMSKKKKFEGEVATLKENLSALK